MRTTEARPGAQEPGGIQRMAHVRTPSFAPTRNNSGSLGVLQIERVKVVRKGQW